MTRGLCCARGKLRRTPPEAKARAVQVRGRKFNLEGAGAAGSYCVA